MIRAFFDGSCEPVNPGGRLAFGVAIYRDHELLATLSRIAQPKVPGQTSNNVAEYLGFIATLDYLKDTALDTEPSVIHGDSKLVIMQMSGMWRIKTGIYAQYAIHARELFSSLRREPQLKWIPREQNTVADALSHPTSP